MKLLLCGALIAILPMVSSGQAALASDGASAFEVASIRVSAPGTQPGVWTDGSPGRIRMMNMNLKQLIGFAYDVEGYRVTASAPLPPEAYDVFAKLPDEVAKLPSGARWARTHVMTQAMLADRFHLTLHRETTEMAVYKLVPVKAGVKIKEVGPNPGDNVFVSRTPGHLSAEQMPMSQLVTILRGELARPVLDMTGVKGVFNIKLEWDPESTATNAAGAGNAAAPNSLPSLSGAIESQLGFKLEAGKSPIEVLVVDRAEKASAN